MIRKTGVGRTWLAATVPGGAAEALAVAGRVQLFTRATSLGGVESLACHPATTTHSEMPDDELRQAGITPGLVRISIGVEDWRDLLNDILQALS